MRHLGALLILLGIVATPVWLTAADKGEPDEKKTLTDAVKTVVQKRQAEWGKETDEATILAGVPGIDTTDVTSGILDELLLRPDPYYYESFGRRDPFVGLISDDARDELEVNPSNIAVVGILWGDNDKFALIETADGVSAILREGDRFRNTSVTSIRRDQVVLYVSQYGVGRTVVLPLTEGKGSKNARRNNER